MSSFIVSGRIIKGETLRKGREKLPKHYHNVALFNDITLDPQDINLVLLFSDNNWKHKDSIVLDNNGFLKTTPAFDVMVMADIMSAMKEPLTPESSTEELCFGLTNALNQDIVKILADISYKVTDISIDDYNWLLGLKLIEQKTNLQKLKIWIKKRLFKNSIEKPIILSTVVDGHFRRQAITAYPMLLFILNALPKTEIATENSFWKITHDIDCGNSLTESLSENANLPKWLIKKINHLSLEGFYLVSAYFKAGDGKMERVKFNWKYIIHLARFLNPNHFPKTAEEWLNFNILVNFTSELFPSRYNNMEDPKNDFRYITNGILKSKVTGSACHDIIHLHPLDVTDDVHRNLVAPFLLFAPPSPDMPVANYSRAITEQLLYGGESLGRISDKITWWHKNSGKIRTELRHQYPDQATILRYWEPITETFTTEEGWTIHSLVDEESLWAEGQAMGHCVGNYGNRCAVGYSHILSIRNAEGDRVSTVEIDETKLKQSIEEGKPIEGVIRQHYAFKNKRPIMEAQTTLQSWFDAIRNEKLTIDFDFLNTSRIKRLKCDNGNSLSIESPCYQADLEEGRILAWREYSYLLKKTVLALGPEGFLAYCSDIGKEISNNNKTTTN
jgi:hypothetical protein